ncbi:MAG: hypothetical protein GSR79_00565 [Desulfurococcales archaeon]|nr:hypothetical protein [Desulfurococcales archaeon]
MNCKHDIYSNRPIEEEIRSLLEGHSLHTPPKPQSEWDAWREARQNRVYINWFTPITREMLSDKGCIEVIIARSSGVDHIDMEAAEENGVCVANQPEIITEAVAEFTIAGILGVLRRMVSMHHHYPKWSREGWPQHLAGFLLRGRRVGLLGAGRIGQSIALKLYALGAGGLLYYSRTAKPALDTLGARRVSLVELFEHSDILVNSLPLTKHTKHLVTGDLLLKLPRNAVYVNIGRGATETPDAVDIAAGKRPDLHFVLDVHPEEPTRQDHPRMKYTSEPRFLLTPHVAGLTQESRTGSTILAVLQARDYLRHKCVWNPVTRNCNRCSWSAPDISRIVDWVRRRINVRE